MLSWAASLATITGDTGGASTASNVTITGGAGLAQSSMSSNVLTLATASQESAFLADGGTTDLTCTSSQGRGSAQVMDVGKIQFCDGNNSAAVLRSGYLYPGVQVETAGSGGAKEFVLDFGGDFALTYATTCVFGTNDGTTCTVDGNCTGGGVCLTNSQVGIAIASVVYRRGDTIQASDMPGEVVRTDSNRTASSGATIDWTAGNLITENSNTPSLSTVGELAVDNDGDLFEFQSTAGTQKITPSQVAYFGQAGAFTDGSTRYHPVSYAASEPADTTATNKYGMPVQMAIKFTKICCQLGTAPTNASKSWTATIYYSSGTRTAWNAGLAVVLNTTTTYACATGTTNIAAGELWEWASTETAATTTSADANCSASWTPQ